MSAVKSAMYKTTNDTGVHTQHDNFLNKATWQLPLVSLQTEDMKFCTGSRMAAHLHNFDLDSHLIAIFVHDGQVSYILTISAGGSPNKATSITRRYCSAEQFVELLRILAYAAQGLTNVVSNVVAKQIIESPAGRDNDASRGDIDHGNVGVIMYGLYNAHEAIIACKARPIVNQWPAAKVMLQKQHASNCFSG